MNRDGQIKQDNVDSAIVWLMVNVTKPPRLHPRGVQCNHLILICGDEDLSRGVRAAQQSHAPDLTVWVFGFRRHINRQWGREATVFHLEEMDVWNDPEVLVQYKALKKVWSRCSRRPSCHTSSSVPHPTDYTCPAIHARYDSTAPHVLTYHTLHTYGLKCGYHYCPTNKSECAVPPPPQGQKYVVWCGVVWCGVVWCGVVWCGVVWCGVVWCGVVWCGVVWCGVVWCGVVWCGVVWCGVVWCGVVWCGVVWCGFRKQPSSLERGAIGSEYHHFSSKRLLCRHFLARASG